MKSLILIGVIGIAGLIAAPFFADRDPNDPRVIVSTAKDAVRSQSKDPDAVQFGKVWVGQVKQSKVACGTFNGKNSYGAYSGEQRFIAGGDLVMTDERHGALINRMWQDSCERFRGA